MTDVLVMGVLGTGVEMGVLVMGVLVVGVLGCQRLHVESTKTQMAGCTCGFFFN